MYRSIAIFAFAVAFTASLPVTGTAQTRATAAGTEITLRNGQNCFNNKCFRYDAARNAVSIQARVPVAAGNVRGSITPEQFNELFYRALRARERSSGRGS